MKTKTKNNSLKLVSLTLLCAAGLAACGNSQNSKNKGGVDIWSTSSAEKIYQNIAASSYAKIKGEAKVDIYAFKGEHEGKHLILTPTADVSTYDASVSDLTNENGDILSKEQVIIYVEKYMNMTKIYDAVSTAPTGKVPDGMVPIENSKKYNDNKIKANENQGLYFDVNIPIEQNPGIYKGEITLDIDGEIKKVPMSVEVVDVVVNEETHSRSVFLDHWQYWNGELDTSRSMYEKYHHTLGEFRLSPHYAVIESELSHSSEGIKYYVDRSYEILQDKHITNLSIPYQPASRDGQTTFSETIMKNYIREFYKKSVENNFNMLSRLVCNFGGIIDEPDDFGIMDRACYVDGRYRVVINEIANELSEVNVEHPMHDELINSIRKIRHIITTGWYEENDGLIDTYCPKACYYDTPEQREHYKDQEEKWWYTCVEPKVPYPTYHTEDTLSSARLLSWMQSNYDVVGNLYWAVNVYGRGAGADYVPTDEYYTGNPSRYPGCNGDGYLFYPGAQYGYYGPLPSLRIQAIRDGNEEYEVFYNLKEKAKSLELDDKGIFPLLTNSLYSGTKVIGTSELVERARRAAAELTLATNNGSDFIVSKCEINQQSSTVDMEFYAKSGSTITVNGKSLSPTKAHKDGNLYSLQDSITKASNDYEIVVSYGNKTNKINAHLCGSVISYGPSDLANSFVKYNSSVTTSVETIDGNEMLKLEVGKGKDAKQSIKFNAPFISQLNSYSQNININIYNPESSPMLFSIGGRNVNNNYDNYYSENYELKPGMNEINVSTIYMKLKETSNINYFFMVFGNTSSKNEPSKTIYIKNVSLMNK